jgi:hypothetical protein
MMMSWGCIAVDRTSWRCWSWFRWKGFRLKPRWSQMCVRLITCISGVNVKKVMVIEESLQITFEVEELELDRVPTTALPISTRFKY